MSEWIQLSGFLVSTANLVCRPQISVSPLSSLVPLDYLPHPLAASTPVEEDVRSFLCRMVDLLSPDHARMRDAAREQLGNDLHPEMLFDIIEDISVQSQAFYKAKQLEAPFEAATLHFDQTLSIVAQNVSRLKTPFSPSSSACEQLELHILAGAYYANALGISISGTRLRNKVCKASQAVLEKRKDHAVTLSSNFRNALSAYLLAYMVSAQDAELSEKNRSELELNGALAMTACLDGLRVRRKHSGRESAEEGTEIRVMHSIYRFLTEMLCRLNEKKVSRGAAQFFPIRADPSMMLVSGNGMEWRQQSEWKGDGIKSCRTRKSPETDPLFSS